MASYSQILALFVLLIFSTSNSWAQQSPGTPSSCPEPIAEKKFVECNDLAVKTEAQCNKLDAVKMSDKNLNDPNQSKAVDAMGTNINKVGDDLKAKKAECDAALKKSLAKCEEAKQAAVQDKKAGECKVAEAEKIGKEADKVKQDATNLDMKASSPAVSPPVQQQAQVQAQEKHVHASNLMSRAIEREDVGYQQKDQATAVESTANEIIQFLNSIKSSTDSKVTATEKTIQTTSDAVEDFKKQTNGEYADKSVRPATKKNDQVDSSGNPGSSNGQGGSGGNSNSGANSNSQTNNSAQDTSGAGGGGGGFGMPSGFGSGSSSSSSSTALQEKQDCTNPAVASSNPVCACRLNPTDSRCSSILAADKINSQTAKKAAKMYEGEEGGGKSFPNAPGGYKDAKDKNVSQTGQMAQGNGSGLSKGVGSGQGAVGTAASSIEANRQREAFASRGQGSGGSYGGGSGSGGSYSAGSGQANTRIPTTFAKATFNSRVAASSGSRVEALKSRLQSQFNSKRRNPSGTIGPDGITGPHTDQFKKIRVRYSELLGL